MPRKTSQGSLRAKLTEDLIADVAANGKQAFERLRQENLPKYCEIASKLILPEADPANPNSLKNAQSMHEIGLRILRSIGLSEPTDEQFTLAIAANDVFVATLEKIRDNTTDLN
jgi:hypothetical protein